jgi:hypothetical protein
LRVFIAILILTGLACSPRAGEAAGSGAPSRPPSDHWKIDFKLSLTEKQGKWIFAVDGYTDLPAETVLRARVYVVTLVCDPLEGLREDDDEALVRDDDGLKPAVCRFKVGSGWFHEEVHVFSRKPYSIPYRAKVSCLPEDQTSANGLKIGNDPFVRKADLRPGSEADYAKELQDRLGEAGRQLMVLEKIGYEIQERLDQRPFNRAAWTAWKEGAGAKLDGIREENAERYALWAVWLEGQSRMRVGGLCELARHILTAVNEGGEDRRLRDLTAGYLESIEEAIDAIGADVPLNPRRATAILQKYDETLAPLRTIPRPSPEVVRRAHADSVTALFDLTAMLRVRRRGYSYVNQVGARLKQVFDRLDASGSELVAAFREHDEALREFRVYACLN